MIEPNISLAIIILTSIVSYLVLRNPSLFEKYKHYPYKEKREGEYVRLFTSGFIHGSYLHLIVNMYVLFTFGGIVEKYFSQLYGSSVGYVVYILFYLSAIVVASLPTYLKNKDNPSFVSIGASGAISSVVFVFIVINPLAPLQIIFFPFIDIPAILLGVGYLIYSSFSTKKSNTKIDHLAHFSGAIYGILFLWLSKPHMIKHFIEAIKMGLQ